MSENFSNNGQIFELKYKFKNNLGKSCGQMIKKNVPKKYLFLCVFILFL